MADVDHGYRFELENISNGDRRDLRIEIAGGGDVSQSRVEEVLGDYLEKPFPPRRVVIAHDGEVARAVP
jgi:hypothetical protein